MTTKNQRLQAPFDDVRAELLDLCEASYRLAIRLAGVRLETRIEQTIGEQFGEAVQLLAAIKWNIEQPAGPIAEADLTNDDDLINEEIKK